MAKAMNQLAPAEMASTAGYGTCDDVMNTLDQTLTAVNAGTGYLCGDAFTAADLYLANALSFYKQFNLIDSTPAMDDYVKRHTSRESFLKARAIDGALMG